MATKQTSRRGAIMHHLFLLIMTIVMSSQATADAHPPPNAVVEDSSSSNVASSSTIVDSNTDDVASSIIKKEKSRRLNAWWPTYFPTFSPSWGGDDWKPTAKPTWNKPTNDWKPTSKPTWKGNDWKPTNKPTWKGSDWKPTNKPTLNKPTNPSGVKRYEIYTAEENPVGHGNWDDHFWWKDIIASVRKECTAIFREDYKNVAKTIRLLFHDCKGHSEGYGCDGCVNLNHSDNNGLEDIMQELRPIVEKFEKYLSRADTWAICALTALGMSTSSFYPMTFIGRQTCEDSDDIGNGGGYFDTYGDEVHTSALVHHFYKYFGFDDKCTVAAMGVHGISKMKPEISGHGNGHYSATWVKDASHMMSNEYFKGFKSYDWTYEVRDNVAYSEFGQKSQWYYGSFDPSRLVLLNADVAMLWNFADYVDDEGNIYCKVSDNVEHHGYRGDPWNVPNCPKAYQTYDAMMEYASDYDLFLTDLKKCMIKMYTTGYREGYDSSYAMYYGDTRASYP